MSDTTAKGTLTSDDDIAEPVLAEGVDDEPVETNRRMFHGRAAILVATISGIYAAFHMIALNGVSISAWTGVTIPLLPTFPMETWNFRIIHIAGALALGFVLFSGASFATDTKPATKLWNYAGWLAVLGALFALAMALSFSVEIQNGKQWNGIDPGIKFNETWLFGAPLMGATVLGIILSWMNRQSRSSFCVPDLALVIAGFAVAAYLMTIFGTQMRNATGTPFAPIGMSIAAVAGTLLILEMTRRVAGLALVIIAAVFLCYTFIGQYLPGVLNSPSVTWQRFFSQVYTDAGILGPTTAVSSTYIILFIIFAGFLQASKVGDYFVNFAFAAAGRSRGGPAKVAIFASGLMGMINGTSAGNVVATGSLTIPLMKRVGYSKQVSGAVEAAASTGGQIMPPIMGAGAFIMAEVTGIPYTEIAIAAILPAVLYYVSVFFMVDFEAAKLGMRGMKSEELPKFREMLKRVYLFIPILILIVALFLGYSVIRAGTLATVAAAVVSLFKPGRTSYVILGAMVVIGLGGYLTGALAQLVEMPSFQTPLLIGTLVLVAAWAALYRGSGMTPARVAKAFELSGLMSIQIIAVCACAGIIVGVISLTGVGARFSNLLLDIAQTSQLLAMVFAMCIAILLGMGMPTTAAYAVAASVVAPGLVDLGVPLLTAHFFVFYFAVVSAITPPVALASYAAAGISGANPMETSVASFKIGISAFIVPFMFFYNSAILMDGTWLEIIRASITAIAGVFLLSAGVQGWFMGARVVWFMRLALIAAAIMLIEGGLVSDLIGVAAVGLTIFVQRVVKPEKGAMAPVRGAD
ncbi:MAG: TRAP transporter fused permease subunit [Pseudomonadota bacterium]